MATTVALYESAQSFAAGLEIDEAKSVVRGVNVLGEVSKNGLLFPEEARRASIPVLEGRWVNWNHSGSRTRKEEVKLENRFGWLSNVREEGGFTRGDLNYFADHPHAKLFLNIARTNPKACGLSVKGDAIPSGNKDSKGRIIVSRINTAESVDLVADAANTIGLREAEAPAATPPAEPAGGEGGDYAADGVIKAIEECLAAGGASRDKIKAIKEHLAKLEEMEGDGDGEGEESEKVEESAKARIRKDCIQLCESEGLKEPDAGFLDILQNVPAAGRLEVVKKYQLKRAARKPKSGTPTIPVQESAKTPTPPAKPEDEVNRIAALLKG